MFSQGPPWVTVRFVPSPKSTRKVYGAVPPVAVRFTQAPADPVQRSDTADERVARPRVVRAIGAVKDGLEPDVSPATSVAVMERFHARPSPPKRTATGPVEWIDRAIGVPPVEGWIHNV